MSWDTEESTGFLTHFTGTIRDSYFGTDERYRNGEVTMCQWEVEVDKVLEEDHDGEIPETVNINLPLGSYWFSEDGDHAEHSKGRSKFQANSFYGKLIDQCMGRIENYGKNASSGDEDQPLVVDLAGLQDVLPGRGEPTTAAIWKGLSFEFAEVHFDYGADKVTKEQITARRTFPVRYLGEGVKAEKAAPKAVQAEVPAAKAAPSTNGADHFPFVADTALAAQLNRELNDAATFNDFVEKVITIDAVNSDDALLAQVLDQDNGPWAQAHS